MKNWKDKVLGIFAGIGIMSLLMGSYSSQSQTSFGTPESHVWEIYGNNEGNRHILLNKKTGETWGIRKQSAGDKWVDKQRIEE